MTKVSSVGWRRWGGVAVTLAVLASLAGVADAGARTPAIAPLGHLPKGTALDYSPAPPGRLTPLSPSFVAQTLGLSFPSAPGPAPTVGSTVGSTLSPPAPAVNPVSTPVYACVNGHQTADPLSPPCVARFSGDNGGATYRGVSRNEVRIVMRMAGGLSHVEGPLTNEETPSDELVDLDKAPAPNEHYLATKARLLQAYFNRHLQLYGRRIHLFVYFDGDSNQLVAPDNPEHQRKAGLELLWRVNPFAVIETNTKSIDDAGAFVDVLARAGAAVFDSVDLLPGDRFDRARDHIWAYRPTVSQMADLFATYVCHKVVGKPVAMSGNPGENGRPRRLGVLYPGVTRPAPYRQLTTAVHNLLRRCGAPVVAEAPLTPTGECGGLRGEIAGFSDGAAVVDDFRKAGVTTVLWLGCDDHNIPQAATATGYAPEWILLGDGNRDTETTVSDDNAQTLFAHHAVAVTWQPTLPSFAQAHCYAAQRESDPSLPASPPTPPGRLYNFFAPAVLPPFTTAGQAVLGCDLYAALLQVAGAIQLAGPRLTAASVATGLHALPYLRSRDPQTPSCFYGSGHACVRDGAAWYWDGSMGCFRAIEGGRRYLEGRWPGGNVNAQITGKEPCASLN